MVNLINKILSDKKTLFPILGLVLILTFIPVHFANAAWFDFVSQIYDYVAMIPLYMLFGMPILFIFIASHIAVIISYVFYSISSILLTWVTSEFFISQPLTKGGIVGPGLQVTTGLVNLGFILVLVFIAISTILRLENFGLKKLLPKFLFIVLLINFVPVICGAIIDIANIVTANFMPNLSNLGNDFLNIFGPGTPLGVIVKAFIDAFSGVGFDWDVILKLITKFATFSGVLGLILNSISVSFFGIFAGFVMLLYVILFMIRVIALWILVILAPIAWFCSILPFTQSFYKMWWNYFIQWAFIGAIAGFFLWLGGKLAAIGTSAFGAFPPIPAEGWQGALGIILAPLTNSLNYLFFLFTIIAFLIIGFILSLKLSGGATNTILKWGEKAGTAAGKWAGRKGWAVAKERWASSERVQGLAQRLATAPTPGAGIPGFRGMLTRATVAPVWALGRVMGKAVGPGLIEAERRDIDAAEKKVAGQRVESQMAAWASTITDKERIGILNAVIKDKNIGDAMDATRFGNAAIPEAEIKRLYNIARTRDKHNTIRTAFPAIAREDLDRRITNPIERQRLLAPYVMPNISEEQQWAQYVFDRTKTADYENMPQGVLDDNEFLEALLRRGTDEHVNALRRRFGIDGALNLERRIEELTPTGMTQGQFLEQINPRLHNYFTRGAGQGLINIPTPPLPPPPRPTPPPEVPLNWVPGPRIGRRETWVPPSGYAPRTYTRAEQNTMAGEASRMTRELNRLRKLPIRSDEDEETIKMLEATIRDIRQRLGK